MSCIVLDYTYYNKFLLLYKFCKVLTVNGIILNVFTGLNYLVLQTNLVFFLLIAHLVLITFLRKGLCLAVAY